MILPLVILDKFHQHTLMFLKILLDLLAKFPKKELGNVLLMISHHSMKTNSYTPVKEIHLFFKFQINIEIKMKIQRIYIANINIIEL